MEPVISIIVPAYNIESYIARALDSLMAQTYQNLEVIVVDDGSKDQTGKIIDEYAGRYDKIKAVHKENGGVTSARLCGLEKCSGQWIGFTDGDDYVEPYMYQRLMENAARYGAEISHCGYQMVFPDGHADYYYNTGEVREQTGLESCMDLAEGRIEPGLVNKIYQRQLLSSLYTRRLLPEDIRINEDALMNYYLFSWAKTCVFEDVCPYHYVLREGSASTSRINRHKLEDPLRVTHIMLEDCAEAVKASVEMRLTRQLIGGATVDNGREDWARAFKKNCRKELRQRLPQIAASRKIGTKLKMMACWTAVCPASYAAVHRIYEKLTGMDKKYSIE